MFSNALRKLSYSRQAEASRLDHIVLVQGKDKSGRAVWFYVMIDHGKLKAFHANQGIALLQLSDYGRILYSGYGQQPSALVSWKMELEYGFVS